MKKSSSGFTLTEMMIVLVILAVLAAIALLIINSNTDHAKKNTCDTNIRIIEGAASLYYAQLGTWPSDIDALTKTQTVNGVSFGPWLKPPEPACPVDPNAAYVIGADGHVTCTH